MVEQYGGYNAWPPIGSPLLNLQRDEHWKQQQHFDNSVNAVSFGFVATAILISMFLVMAIFERFLRPASGRSHVDIESQLGFDAKLGHPSPKMTVYSNGVSVLMPGDSIPTFIAHPAPVPCPPERICCPHQLPIDSFSNPSAISNANPTENSNSRSSSSQENHAR